ncbi:hypothetical protein [Mycolicibacterium brumae]|uniref:hypothetical protein n=1 Tax=Mycolicibacterium brumae TaxID=85968 RepID=UPI000FE202C9|nr:hypothetical protein [Mycolicibacterium brumae]MCV7194479.1 hypothetical protein [Mycolicibacterium brumae]UWW10014.1 hypothetical protein L2Z93_003132 [Mycolicibacterium brumae]
MLQHELDTAKRVAACGFDVEFRAVDDMTRSSMTFGEASVLARELVDRYDGLLAVWIIKEVNGVVASVVVGKEATSDS